MENEIWKNVEEFENLYEISNFGRLRNKPRMVNSLIGNRGFRVTTSKIKPTQDNGKGYKQYYVQINKNDIFNMRIDWLQNIFYQTI